MYWVPSFQWLRMADTLVTVPESVNALTQPPPSEC